MSHNNFFGRYSSWKERESAAEEEDFLWDKQPAKFSKEEIRQGSACGEGGCE